MGKVKTCARCRNRVDRGACNETFGILTIQRDTDETGTKIQRIYLCGNCAEHLKLDIEIDALKNGVEI